jgi:hypothetical protein
MLNDSETFEGIDWNAVRAMFGVSEQVGTKESVDTEARIRKLAYNTAKIALHSKIRMATRRIKHIIANGRVY